MANFVLAYHGGKKFETKEEGMAHRTKWMAWVEGLGTAAVNPGMYFGMSQTVSANGIADDGGANPLNGVTIIEADTIDAVLKMAKQCPHIDIGGTIEVAEVMQM